MTNHGSRSGLSDLGVVWSRSEGVQLRSSFQSVLDFACGFNLEFPSLGSIFWRCYRSFGRNRIILGFYKYPLWLAFEGKSNKSNKSKEIKDFTIESCVREILVTLVFFSILIKISPLISADSEITLNLVFLFLIICFIVCYNRSLSCFRCRISMSTVVFQHNACSIVKSNRSKFWRRQKRWELLIPE